MRPEYRTPLIAGLITAYFSLMVVGILFMRVGLLIGLAIVPLVLGIFVSRENKKRLMMIHNDYISSIRSDERVDAPVHEVLRRSVLMAMPLDMMWMLTGVLASVGGYIMLFYVGVPIVVFNFIFFSPITEMWKTFGMRSRKLFACRVLAFVFFLIPGIVMMALKG
jgi:hypothetical protein